MIIIILKELIQNIINIQKQIIMNIIIKQSKICFRMSNMYYDKENQIITKFYKGVKSSGPFNLPVKFVYAEEKPTLWNRIFLDKQLAGKFQYVMQMVGECTSGGNQTGEAREQDLASQQKNSNDSKQDIKQISTSKTKLAKKYPNIQQNLLNNIHDFMKSRTQQVIIHQCTVHRAFYLQQRKISGVFFHRKLNLPKSCYSTQFIQKTRQLKYRLKNKLSKIEDIKQKQRIEKIYNEEQPHLGLIYKDTYQTFQQKQFITRSLIKIVADLKIEVRVPEFQQSFRIGYDGPSQHVLQFQSYKIPYQQEEWVVSDIDFFLQGNYYFLKDKS